MVKPTARLLLFFCWLVPLRIAAGEEPALPPYERSIRLEVWGGTLVDAAREMRRQAGVEIAIFLSDFSGDVENQPLYLVTGDATLRQVMECIARRYGCRYRMVRNSRIEMSRGYDWVEVGSAAKFYDITPIFGPGGDMDATLRLLGEFLRVLPLLPGHPFLAIEESPSEDGTKLVEAVAILPHPLNVYFEQVVAALAGRASANPETAAQPVRARVERATEWKEVLAIGLDLSETGVPPREAARAVARSANAALVWKSRPSEEALRREPVVRGGTVGVVSRELGAWSGLGKRILLEGGGIVLDAGRDGEIEEEKGGREFFWEGLSVSGFGAARAAARSGGGDELLARLRKEVFPEIWLDPVCGIGYSPVTGRIAVVAPLNVVEAVGQALRIIAEG
ncbi:MAG: hypothetical protein LBT97_01515 [Planctomycetota bacterium]|jgi:hypothetical protein|nr:hypothetical protein [Planctomycetota bacterium]